MMHHYTKSSNVEALSIYNQQYQSKLNRTDNSRKHLLGLLSSFTREEQEVRSEEVEDLCCYDRMKKLINRGENQPEQQQKDLVSAIVIEQKINQMETKFNRSEQRLKTKPIPQQKQESVHFLRRSCIIDDIKKNCLEKFLSHKHELQSKGVEEQRKWVEREMIQEKKMSFTRLKEQKAALEKQILTKNLEIQALKSREISMKEYIRELEEKCQGRQESKRATVNSRNSSDLQQRFNEAFGGMSVDEVKRQLEFSVGKCLQQFDRVENKNQVRMKDQQKNYELRCEKMQQKIEKLQARENELIANLKNIKLNKQISQIEINQLCKAKLRLEHMEKLILSIYNEWYAQRSEGQKKLMKCFGNLSENYSYDDMLKYIVQYGKKYSTNQKLNDYLFKVLRGVQKIKRVIYPDQCNEKLDALASMEKIEKWIKIKVSQANRILPKKRTNNQEKNASYLFEAQQ